MADPQTMQYVRINEQAPNKHIENGGRSKSLYISHFLSTWNSRGFEFGAILFLANIYPGTLLPMSVYALVRSLAAILLSPSVGKFIDSSNRLKVVRCSIIGQRLAVTISCVAFLALLLYKDVLSKTASLMMFVILMLLACIEKLCIILNTLAVERDWLVVIAADDEAFLRELNSQMRRIDLFCKLVSPLVIALLDGVSSVMAIGVTLSINSISVPAEYLLIAWVYRRTPSLALSPDSHTPIEAIGYDSGSLRTITRRTMASILEQAKSYTKSHAFLPSLSLSILYLTVLSFSGQMVTYLFTIQQPRLSSIHIGILRTIATSVEISATYIAPVLINRLGPVRAGIWSLSWQFTTLTPGVATFWIFPATQPTTKTVVFIASVISSRVGLWSYDLTAQLLVQNSVDASNRGSFSATESSLQNLFELGTFAMTIIWSEPEDFNYPATISLVAVYVAAAMYARYVRVERGHLLHLPDCCTAGAKYDILGNEDAQELQEFDEDHRLRAS